MPFCTSVGSRPHAPSMPQCVLYRNRTRKRQKKRDDDGREMCSRPLPASRCHYASGWCLCPRMGPVRLSIFGGFFGVSFFVLAEAMWRRAGGHGEERRGERVRSRAGTGEAASPLVLAVAAAVAAAAAAADDVVARAAVVDDARGGRGRRGGREGSHACFFFSFFFRGEGGPGCFRRCWRVAV